MHQIHPDYPAPYTLVVVELDDAPEVRLMGRLDGEPELSRGSRCRCGSRRLATGRPCRNGSRSERREPQADLGITTYNYEPQDLLTLAVHAERLGFEGLWFGEHYVIPRSYAGHHPSRKETPPTRTTPATGRSSATTCGSTIPGFPAGRAAGRRRSG
jgi:hypothetical protein